MTAIHVDDVWFGYGRGPVLEGVAFSIDGGDIVALLGPNGAGKTTLTRLLVGLLQPDRGRVTIGGLPTAGRKPEDLASRVSYLFQDPDQQLFARTVLDEVAFAPWRLGASRGAARAAARAAIEQVGLMQRETAHPYDLSPTERRFVALAAALAQGAPVLVLDEPARAMDVRGASRVGEVVRRCAAAGKTVVVVTHDLQFVVEYCRRAVILAGGRVGADLAAADVVRDPSWARSLGLRVPAAAALSLALRLPGLPVRGGDVVAALVARRGDPGRPPATPV